FFPRFTLFFLSFFFLLRLLPSFPTRRSSDLFFTAENFSCAIFFHNNERGEFHPFKSCEAESAVFTFPASSDGREFIGMPRIDHFGTGLSARWTFHIMTSWFGVRYFVIIYHKKKRRN